MENQIKYLASILKSREIMLADDVVFTGSVLRKIISMFSLYGVKVVGVVSSISTQEGYDSFNENLKYGIKCNYLLGEDVIDQICERDFYFGIAGSGIMIKDSDGLYKAPYFMPYGDPDKRASIPEEYQVYFSKGCLKRSIYLWEEIEKLKKDKVLIGELPERIINTNIEDRVVKVLRKEMDRL